ncbi:hypothetical protein CKO31_12055 [Thiohalocapsa halophila]|uniref:Uncharacterized protein n=1 Tax=Thiohalocapsa halophila TaxID=69359 RepID=A0ABS1CHQ8_9GAMM|nr:hypothetical protein [Thiohalocapsa halophila]MBK1631461.1 hypothetical protein [Thiohalocapsa halophila]
MSGLLLPPQAAAATVDLPQGITVWNMDPELGCDLSTGCSFSAADIGVGSHITATNPVTNIAGARTAYPLVVTLSGTLAASGGDNTGNLFSLASVGLPAGDYPDEDGGTSLVNAQAFVNGAAVTLSNSAALTQSDAPASGLTIAQQDQTAYAVSGAGALMAASIGSDGYADGNKNPDSDNFNGGDGGAIDVSVSGSGSRRALAPWAIYARSRPAASTPPTRALRAR